MQSSRDYFEASLRNLYSQVHTPDEGFFGPDSILWKVNRESCVLLGAGSATLLQLAHPYIAQAFQRDPSLQKDLLARFNRTFSFVFSMVFGDLEQATKSAKNVYKLQTKLEEIDKVSDTEYVDALFWVSLTYFHSSMQIYQWFFGRLSSEEKNRYYQEYRKLNALCGIPEDFGPSNWEALQIYFQEKVNHTLKVEAYAIDLAKELLAPGRAVATPAMKMLRVLTVKLLPTPIRRAYGLRLDLTDKATYQSMQYLLPRLYHRIPKRIRFMTAYQEASKRLQGRTTKAYKPGALEKMSRWGFKILLASKSNPSRY